MPVGCTNVLREITRAAGTIFSGTVISVTPGVATKTQSLGTIAVTFYVERAIRGVRAGENFTIHEWLGLSGERYRVGERLLLFLFPPSKLGLTSPVGGPMGRFTVDGTGHVLIGPYIGTLETDSLLAGKSRVTYEEFARAVRRASGEE